MAHKTTVFDFSPTIRTAVDCGQVKRAALAQVANVHPTTIDRMYHGQTQPDAETLARWARAVHQLPHCFRQACSNAIGGGSGYTVVVDDLDADGDGRVTMRDASLVECEKQMTAARRHQHIMQAGLDGRITKEELAEQAMFTNLEAHACVRQQEILAHVAAHA